jgi:hypothetical protein
VPSTDIGRRYHDLVPEVGITATPVIDLARGGIYVAAKTKEPLPPSGRHHPGIGGVAGGGDKKAACYYRLHALDLATGARKPGNPVTITASVPGRGVRFARVGHTIRCRNTVPWLRLPPALAVPYRLPSLA